MYDLPKFVPCHAETKSFALAFINNEDWSMKEHLLLHLNKGLRILPMKLVPYACVYILNGVLNNICSLNPVRD